MQKILSYILPIRLKTYTSKINGIVKVHLTNGRKTLDTAKSNYSYGSLQRILERWLSEIGLDHQTKSILVLGLGGGSVVETIREHFHSSAYLTLVDIDPEMISIARSEFGIERFLDIEIIESDAYVYLADSRDVFDLIIVDIFLIDTIPDIFTEEKFLKSLSAHLSQNGKIIYNTMRRSLKREVLEEMITYFRKDWLQVKLLEKIAGSNDLIIAER